MVVYSMHIHIDLTASFQVNLAYSITRRSCMMIGATFCVWPNSHAECRRHHWSSAFHYPLTGSRVAWHCSLFVVCVMPIHRETVIMIIVKSLSHAYAYRVFIASVEGLESPSVLWHGWLDRKCIWSVEIPVPVFVIDSVLELEQVEEWTAGQRRFKRLVKWIWWWMIILNVVSLMFVYDRWLASHYGYGTTKTSAPCQEFLLFINVTQVGKTDLCLDSDADAQGMVCSCAVS